jgi:hypothetical protein
MWPRGRGADVAGGLAFAGFRPGSEEQPDQASKGEFFKEQCCDEGEEQGAEAGGGLVKERESERHGGLLKAFLLEMCPCSEVQGWRFPEEIATLNLRLRFTADREML